MAKMKVRMKELEKFEANLLKLENLSREMIGEAIFDGAGVVADAVKASIETIPIDNRFATGSTTLYGITEEQKQGLRDGFGIAPMRDDGGYIHVKLGFDGYNSQQTKKYPGGQPNSLIARSVNTGTSFRQRFPFIDNAANQSRSKAEDKMIKKFDDAVNKVMN